MKKLSYVLLLMAFVFSSVVFAADFKPYPGAKLEKQLKRQINWQQAAKWEGSQIHNLYHQRFL